MTITAHASPDSDSATRQTMQARTYTVRLLTPAFIGNADQIAEWRTPPIKALLRQWWRVAYVRGRSPSESMRARMHQEEGRLFGNAWLDANDADKAANRKNGHCRSLLRIRLQHGEKNAWASGTQSGVAPMSDGLQTSYAWFGIVDKQNNTTRTRLDTHGDNSHRALKLAYPEAQQESLESALRLIQTFGQIGYRCRTGWGSLHFDEIKPLDLAEMRQFSRDTDECLEHDWAHALGRDDQGCLVWESEREYTDWARALSIIASLRKDVRTSLKSTTDMRPLLGFASGDKRMPSPLRWRLFKSPNEQLKIRVFAFPHQIPSKGGKTELNRHAKSAWSAVIRALDGSQLQRVREL